MVHSSEIDRSRTLTELEGEDWGEPTYPSHLVTTCHALRYKPLRDFTVEDLRILIGQSFSLPYLIPLAFERLRETPLVSGDLYPGDLLMAVLRSDLAFWQKHPELRPEMRVVIDQLTTLPADHADDLARLEPNLSLLLARFGGLGIEGRMRPATTEELVAHILGAVRTRQWHDALTLYRDATGEGVVQAREAVKAIAAQHGVSWPR